MVGKEGGKGGDGEGEKPNAVEQTSRVQLCESQLKRAGTWSIKASNHPRSAKNRETYGHSFYLAAWVPLTLVRLFRTIYQQTQLPQI